MSVVEDVEKKIGGPTGIKLDHWPLFIVGIILLFIAFLFLRGTFVLALSLALFLAPLWLPFLLVGGAWRLWYIWQRSEFLAKQKYILLEVKPPRSLVKTPLAMETFLTTIHYTGGESTWYARFRGGTRPSWSLEIVSLEGQVHFYIWGEERFRRTMESQLYAQYPGVQITESPDYSRLISATPEEWAVWGVDYKKSGKEDALPIRTYVEFGLDKVQKEPEQVDPLSQIIEFMGSLGKGEYLWLQFLIRAHKGEKYGKTNKEGKVYTWKDEAKEMIEKIRGDTRETYTDTATGEERPGFPNPTKAQSEKMAAIDRNVSKPRIIFQRSRSLPRHNCNCVPAREEPFGDFAAQALCAANYYGLTCHHCQRPLILSIFCRRHFVRRSNCRIEFIIASSAHAMANVSSRR